MCNFVADKFNNDKVKYNIMEREETFYQVESFNKKTSLHMCYSVYEDKGKANEFKKFLEYYDSSLVVWINTVTVYFKK